MKAYVWLAIAVLLVSLVWAVRANLPVFQTAAPYDRPRGWSEPTDGYVRKSLDINPYPPRTRAASFPNY